MGIHRPPIKKIKKKKKTLRKFPPIWMHGFAAEARFDFYYAMEFVINHGN